MNPKYHGGSRNGWCKKHLDQFKVAYTFCLKVIRHVFGFDIESLENKDIGIFEYFIVIDLSIGIATILIFHLFQLSDLELGVLSVMVNEAYL